MDPNIFTQVPFLTREMLKFGKDAKLELVITTTARDAVTIRISGLTRSGVITGRHTTTNDSVTNSTTIQIDDIPTLISITPTTSVINYGRIYAQLGLRVNGII